MEKRYFLGDEKIRFRNGTSQGMEKKTYFFAMINPTFCSPLGKFGFSRGWRVSSDFLEQLCPAGLSARPEMFSICPSTKQPQAMCGFCALAMRLS